MMTQEKISQWMDGEVDEEVDEEIERSVYRALKDDAGRETWALYHRIGDVLRDGAQCGTLSAGFTARVAQALAAEPTVLAPQAAAATQRKAAISETRPYYRAWALAATITGAAVVGWMAFTLQNDAGMSAEEMVYSGAAEPVVAGQSEMVSPADLSMQEAVPYSRDPAALVPADYLTTHEEFSPSASMWSGINTYQRVDGAWGYDLANGQKNAEKRAQ